MPAFDDAIAYALAHEIDWTRDPVAEPHRWGIHQADPPPWNRLLGPVHARGGVCGVVRQHGKERCRWGDPHRADLTFSVAKTYLAFLAGRAHAGGRLPDPDRPVCETLPGIGFDSAHNRSITWSHLLSQTSEWEGACFGVPDTVDRWRTVSFDPRPPAGTKGQARPLQAPGAYWEYNDVRINQLSLALQHLWREPLAQVFEREVRARLGARDPFAWRGYDGVTIDLPARGASPAAQVACTPGGSHWGGGVSISAYDQALIGELLLWEGRAGPQPSDAQIVPADWIRRMRQPQALAPFYGWLVWLNTADAQGRLPFPGAGEGSVFMMGAGGHFTWIAPAHDAVIVVRWLDPAHLPGFAERCLQALS
jgi:CubicO group peptidase (beta-lactamase class C family)